MDDVRGPGLAVSLVMGLLVTEVLVGALFGLWILWMVLVVNGVPVWVAWALLGLTVAGIGLAVDRARRQGRHDA